MFGQKVKVDKENVAVIVVIMDICICFFFWFALLAMKPLQDAVQQDLNLFNIDPEDFTVVVKQNPYMDKYEELRPIYWAWAEHILEKERNRHHNPNLPRTPLELIQTQVLNVNFGFANYGHLNYYKEMGHLLTLKKTKEK
jgi:hypothetical protein